MAATDSKVVTGASIEALKTWVKSQTGTDISGKADKANITAGTAGTSSDTSGSTVSVPYVTMNAQGIVTGYGTHNHTVTGFAPVKDCTLTQLGSFTASTGNHTVTSVANYKWIVVRLMLGTSGCMYGFYPRNYLRTIVNSSSNPVTIFSDEGWLTFRFSSNTNFVVVATSNSANTVTVHGLI